MRYLMLLALVTSACGGSPNTPTRTPSARLAVASGPTLSACGVTCTYTVAVINNGPDCASGVGVSIVSTVAQGGGRIAVQGIQSSVPGIVRAGQVVTLGGTDWPAAGANPALTVKGDGVSCP